MIHFSLFSGIGGFDLASEWAGWKNYLSCEINEFGNKVLNHYWPEAYHHTDIKTLTYDTINAELSKRFGTDWRNDDIIISGGFPCQPFSTAGKRLGKEDERHLWPEMLRAIREIQPRYVVGENVRGIASWSDGLVFEEVCSDLESQGYEVQAFLLPAVGINAPHKRDRFYFVAKNTNQDGWGSNERKEESQEWGQRNPGTGADERIRADHEEVRNASDSEQQRLEGQHRERNRFSIDRGDQGLLFGSEDKFNAADSQRTGLEFSQDAGNVSSIGGTPQTERGKSAVDSQTDDHVCTEQGGPSETWEYFPTKSPLCSGDDGLPIQLDGPAFRKWRKESLMGYGNAIVPQIAYRIFATINEIENK